MRTEQSTKCLYHISNGWCGCRCKTSLSPPVIHCWPFRGGGSDVVSVSCFGVRFSVMFHFMFVHTFGSVWVAEWPPFGEWLPARLAICSPCVLSVCGVCLFLALVLRAGFAF